MARGGKYYLPKKLYYVKKASGEHLGPYTKKTTQMCRDEDEIITWVKDVSWNYMIQTIKAIRKQKLKNINDVNKFKI